MHFRYSNGYTLEKSNTICKCSIKSVISFFNHFTNQAAADWIIEWAKRTSTSFLANTK